MISWLVGRLGRATPYFPGKQRLARALLHGKSTANIFGIEMDLDLSEFHQMNMFAGCYEPHETKLVKSYLQPGHCFVDVGANMGHYTALAHSIVGPTGKVFAFEPDPYMADRLAHLTRNLDNVVVEAVGLSEKSDNLVLYVPPADALCRDPAMVEYCDGMTTQVVPVIRLDDYLDAPIDILKLDVEGHELSVLRGAERLLQAGMVNAVLCEFNEPLQELAGHSSAELRDFLLGHGFHDRNRMPLSKFETRFLTRRTEV